MTSDARNWNLFGLDLKQYWSFVRLGFDQLFFGWESPIAKKFYPPVNLISLSDGSIAKVNSSGDATYAEADQLVDFWAIEVPQEQVLVKKLVFPVGVEPELEGIVSVEASNLSPFAEGDTAVAWSVCSRSATVLEVVLAITSQAMINKSLADLEKIKPSVTRHQVEVWAQSDYALPVIFRGYGEVRRLESYVQYLRKAIIKTLLICSLFFAALVVPTLAVSMRADSLEQNLNTLKQQAAVATALRADLERSREQLDVVEKDLDERLDYQFWLNHIAAVSPDDVYLQSLTFRQNKVEVSGYASNAAKYLSNLADQDRYTNVTAVNAFVRDQRRGLDRFGIKWELIPMDGSNDAAEVDPIK